MKESNHKKRLVACHRWASFGVQPFVFYCNYHNLTDDDRCRIQSRFNSWWSGSIEDYPTLEKFEAMIEEIKWG